MARLLLVHRLLWLRDSARSAANAADGVCGTGTFPSRIRRRSSFSDHNSPSYSCRSHSQYVVGRFGSDGMMPYRAVVRTNWNMVVTISTIPRASNLTRARWATAHLKSSVRYSSSNNNNSISSDQNQSKSKHHSRIISATQWWLEDIVVGHKLCPFAVPLLKCPRKIRIVICPHNEKSHRLRFVRQEVEYLMTPVDDTDNDSSQQHHETTLIVFDDENENGSTVNDDHNVDPPPGRFLSTNTYLDFVRFSWELQEYAILGQLDDETADEKTRQDPSSNSTKNYQDDVQIVLFHPNATHQTYGQEMTMDSDGVDDDPNFDAGDYTIRSPYPTIHLLREMDVLSAVKSGYPGLEYLPSRNQAKMKNFGTPTCAAQLEACKMKAAVTENRH